MKKALGLAGFAATVLVYATAMVWAQEEPAVGGRYIESYSPRPEGGNRNAEKPCLKGYVWREARPQDHVCVLPETRAAVAEQNRIRKQRWTQGAYGPNTCIQGFVWREAFPGDKVCVTGEFRDETSRDNAAQESRIRK